MYPIASVCMCLFLCCSMVNFKGNTKKLLVETWIRSSDLSLSQAHSLFLFDYTRIDRLN